MTETFEAYAESHGRAGAQARFSDWLRARAEPAWGAAVSHRFTRELAADSLPDAVYARYLIQDYVFLDVLARAVALAIAAAPDMPPKSRLSAFLAAVTSEENDTFLRSFEALGVAEAEWRDAQPAPVTGDLRDLMLGAAKDGYAPALAVLLPAEWIYLSWATAVKDRKPARFYLREWIEIHTLPEFEAFVAWLRAETDRLGAALPPEGQARLGDLFREMAELEAAFFDAAYVET